MIKHTAFQIIWQSAIICIIAAAVGLLSNMIRQDALSLPGKWTSEAGLTSNDGTSIVISLEEARNLFFSKNAVFFDARASKNFQAGHIKEAISFPWDTFDEYAGQLLGKLPEDQIIITYCDGETCCLSKDLAFALIDLGFNNTRVLINGWEVWQKDKLPVETDSVTDNCVKSGPGQ